MGRTYSLAHAAALASQLPEDARLHAALDPERKWDARMWLLWSIEFSLRVLRWQRTEDGEKGLNKPKPVPDPVSSARMQSRLEATDMESIAQIIGLEV